MTRTTTAILALGSLAWLSAAAIAVAATTRTDDLASFSNFGRQTVDLGAPGASILSTCTSPSCSRRSTPFSPGSI